MYPMPQPTVDDAIVEAADSKGNQNCTQFIICRSRCGHFKHMKLIYA